MPVSTATSEVAFTQLVKDHGLEHLLPILGSSGFKTAATFAISCGVNYSQVKPKRFTKTVICPLLGFPDGTLKGGFDKRGFPN